MASLDTSINSLALAVVTALLAVVAGVGLTMVFSDPTTHVDDAVIVIAAIVIGFGVVHGAVHISSVFGK